MTMKVGIMLPVGGETSWSTFAELAKSAEAHGLDSVWFADHLFIHFPGEEARGLHESWTLMSAVAAVTDRLEIGNMVLCASFRSPGLLAKMAATLAHIAPGRLILGVG